MTQISIESELDKRGGKSFGPPGGKKMTIFMDDLSMPEKNGWGDQPTLELVRQAILDIIHFIMFGNFRTAYFVVDRNIWFLLPRQGQTRRLKDN